jgi:hypothetical protein
MGSDTPVSRSRLRSDLERYILRGESLPRPRPRRTRAHASLAHALTDTRGGGRARAGLDLMVGKIGFSYEPIQAFPSRQGCTPESYELVATFISV